MAVLGLNAILTGMLVVLFVVISVMMMLVVLIQRPTGGGLSGAFGASSEGAGQTAFGAKTGDALTTATIVIFLLFLGCAVGLNFALHPPEEAIAPQATENAAGGTAPTDAAPGTVTTTPAVPDDTIPPPAEEQPDGGAEPDPTDSPE